MVNTMKLHVNRYGPIDNLTINVTDFLILIGKQSSGKSTISKLIYFFLNIRDEAFDFTIECLESGRIKDVKNNFIKRINKRFVEFFGPSVHDEQMEIVFSYDDKTEIKICTNSKDRKFFFTTISDNVIGTIVEIISQNNKKFSESYSRVKLFSSSKSNPTDIEIEKIQKDISKKLNQVFNFSFSLLFIPAGRSILSTLSDQLQNIHPHLLDFPMRTFIQKVANTKAFFGKSLEDIVSEKRQFSSQQIWQNKINKSIAMIKRIIHGEYIHDESGGRIQLENNKYVKINFTSSGQQECIWIVLSLFLIVLEQENVMVFIEEPEAHLFPDGQKDVSDFIVMVRSMIGARFIITTHSPYILSSINNALYAYHLKTSGFNTKNILDEHISLNFKDMGAYRIDHGKLDDIREISLQQIDSAKIDACSHSINNTYSQLEELEFSDDR